MKLALIATILFLTLLGFIDAEFVKAYETPSGLRKAVAEPEDVPVAKKLKLNVRDIASKHEELIEAAASPKASQHVAPAEETVAKVKNGKASADDLVYERIKTNGELKAYIDAKSPKLLKNLMFSLKAAKKGVCTAEFEKYILENIKDILENPMNGHCGEWKLEKLTDNEKFILLTGLKVKADLGAKYTVMKPVDFSTKVGDTITEIHEKIAEYNYVEITDKIINVRKNVPSNGPTVTNPCKQFKTFNNMYQIIYGEMPREAFKIDWKNLKDIDKDVIQIGWELKNGKFKNDPKPEPAEFKKDFEEKLRTEKLCQ